MRLISAFRRAETFRGDAQVTTWLHRIVVNACLDRMRRARRRADRAAAGGRGPARPSWPPSPRGPGGGQRAPRRRDGRARRSSPTTSGRRWCSSTWRATPSTRPPRSSECAPGTVKSRCSRGRARLVPLLTQYRRTSPDPGGANDAARSRNHHDPAHVQADVPAGTKNHGSTPTALQSPAPEPPSPGGTPL